MKSKAQKECDVRLKKIDRLLQPFLRRFDPLWHLKRRVYKLERKFGLA